MPHSHINMEVAIVQNESVVFVRIEPFVKTLRRLVTTHNEERAHVTVQLVQSVI